MDPGTLLLSLLALLFALWIGYLAGKAAARGELARRLPDLRREAVERSRAVLTGQLVEQLAPYLPHFPWRPTECRFIGKPIDFLVFKGLDERSVSEVVFVEVKSGRSSLSGVERSLRDAVRSGKVSWAEYRLDQPAKGNS